MDELEQWIAEQITLRYVEAVQADVDLWVNGTGGGIQLRGLLNAPAVQVARQPAERWPWTCRAGTWGPW